jgi:hypothetical protein
MMETTIQMEIIAVVGILSGVALYMGQFDLAQTGIAGLIGFLGGQAIIQAKNSESHEESA